MFWNRWFGNKDGTTRKRGKHVCDDESVTPEMDAQMAREILADGDTKHGVFHLGRALQEHPERADWVQLLDDSITASDDPTSLYPAGDGLHACEALVKVRVLAWKGFLPEAIGLMTTLDRALGDVQFLMHWGLPWLEESAVDLPEDTVAMAVGMLYISGVNEFWRNSDDQLALGDRMLKVCDDSLANVGASASLEQFDLAGNWQRAKRLARVLGDDAVNDLLAVMVRPPPPPPGRSEIYWFPRIQMTACDTIAQLPGGMDVLEDLLMGPMDWTCGTAAVSLMHLALNDPSLANLVCGLFLERLKFTSNETACCYRDVVLNCIVMLPDIPDDVKKMANDLLERT